MKIGEWRNEQMDNNMFGLQNNVNYISNDAKKIREEFADYFINEGEISWQYKYV